MKMKFDLKKLRERIEAEKNKGNKGFFQPSKLPDDTTVNIRILPLKDGSHWRVEHVFHKVPGDDSPKVYTCPESFDENMKCPFCERARKYYSEGNEDMGSLYWKKRQYYANIIVRPTKAISNFDELEMPLVFRYGKKLEGKFESAVMDDDIGIFFDPVEGFDFKLHKTSVKVGKNTYPNYDQSEFARKPSAACDSENEFEEIMDRAKDLNSFVPNPLSYDELKALLSGAVETSPVRSTNEFDQAVNSGNSQSSNQESPVVEPAKLDGSVSESPEDMSEDDEIAALLAKIESET